jgi:uncharacterized protein (TIGR03546 family)
MFFVFQQVVALLKLLHSDNSDSKIAWAFLLGLFASVSPILSLQGIFFVLIAAFIRVQLAAFLLSWLLFSIVSFLFVGSFHSIGFHFLSLESMNPIYITMQKNTVLSLTRFNNTVVLGGLLTVLFLSPAFLLVFKWAIQKYRAVFVSFITSTKVYYFIKSTFLLKLYGFYEKYEKI